MNSDSQKTSGGSSLPDLHDMIRTVDADLTAELLRYASWLPMSQITMGKEVLRTPGKVMWAASHIRVGSAIPILPRWPLLVLLSCQACMPDQDGAWKRAVPAAISVELAMAAADLLDEVTDSDPSAFIEKHGTGQAINTGNLMLVMAQQALVRRAVDDEMPYSRLCSTLQDMLVRAAVGQHLDMIYEKMPVDVVTLEMSAEMTGLKAGALVSGACRIGALCSEASKEIVDTLARFGQEFGSMAQISNDLLDVTPSGSGIPIGTDSVKKTDLLLRKRTLPIVFALREEAERPNAVQMAFGGIEDFDEETLREAVVQSGGAEFGALVYDVHRQHAFETLDALELLCPGSRDIMMLLFSEAAPTPGSAASVQAQ